MSDESRPTAKYGASSPTGGSTTSPAILELAHCVLREMREVFADVAQDSIRLEVLLRDARVNNSFMEARDLFLWTLSNIAGAPDHEVATSVAMTRLTVANARNRMRHRRRTGEWLTRSNRFLAFINSDYELTAQLRKAVFESGRRQSTIG